MKAQIYLRGIEELEKQTNKMLKELGEEKTKLLLSQAKIVRDRIKQKAPQGPTGNLKKSVYAVALPETVKRYCVAYAGVRPRKAPHAHLLEFGTSGRRYPSEKNGKKALNTPWGPRASVKPMPATPFVRPAWEEIKRQVNENIQKGLKKIVEGKK